MIDLKRTLILRRVYRSSVRRSGNLINGLWRGVCFCSWVIRVIVRGINKSSEVKKVLGGVEFVSLLWVECVVRNWFRDGCSVWECYLRVFGRRGKSSCMFSVFSFIFRRGIYRGRSLFYLEGFVRVKIFFMRIFFVLGF